MRQKKLKLTKENEKMLNDAIKDVMKRPTVRGTPRDARRRIPRPTPRLRDLVTERIHIDDSVPTPNGTWTFPPVIMDEHVPENSAVLINNSSSTLEWQTTPSSNTGGVDWQGIPVEPIEPSMDDPSIQIYPGSTEFGYRLVTPLTSRYYHTQTLLTDALMAMPLTGDTVLRLQEQINLINENRGGRRMPDNVWNQASILGAESGFNYEDVGGHNSLIVPANNNVSVATSSVGSGTAARLEMLGTLLQTQEERDRTFNSLQIPGPVADNFAERIDQLYNFVISNQETMAVSSILTISDPFEPNGESNE